MIVMTQANSMATAYTSHPCDTNGPERWFCDMDEDVNKGDNNGDNNDDNDDDNNGDDDGDDEHDDDDDAQMRGNTLWVWRRKIWWSLW